MIVSYSSWFLLSCHNPFSQTSSYQAKKNTSMDEDTTDGVKLTVTEKIRETFVDVHGDSKVNENINLTEKTVVKVVIIDAHDYGEDSEKPDQYRLSEIWYNIQPLSNIDEIKRNVANDLSLVNIETENINDFYLGCMNLLKNEKISVPHFRTETENSIHDTLEKSMLLFYLASLLIDYAREYTKNVDIKKSLGLQEQHLQNVCKVLQNALEVNGWSVPELGTTRNKFEEFKAKLPSYMDEYLTLKYPSTYSSAGSEADWLRQHKQLVVNYEIISEVQYEVSRLCVVLNVIKADVLDDENANTALYAEVSERTTVWAVNDRADVREYYA